MVTDDDCQLSRLLSSLFPDYLSNLERKYLGCLCDNEARYCRERERESPRRHSDINSNCTSHAPLCATTSFLSTRHYRISKHRLWQILLPINCGGFGTSE